MKTRSWAASSRSARRAERRFGDLGGEPWNINDTYYPFDLIKGSEIMNPADIARSSNQAFAELGYEQVRAIDEIEIRMPLPDEVGRLDLAADLVEGDGCDVALIR
ncbi:MAG: hypothetical protein GEU86_05165 [Actinophytocola sp.]|nr:hypothetical protein [Actinophytocola sp.]